MAKEFKKWIDEFVENGANPKDVTNWPEEAGEPIELQDKAVSPSTIRQEVTADEAYDGLGTVTVEAIELQNKTVSPTTVSQEVEADADYDGLGTVTVEGVELQDKTVTPTTTQQIIEANVDYDGLSKVTVNAVTSAIDSNIKAENIKKDVAVLGVTGIYDGEPVELQDKTVSPTTENQNVTADEGYDGLGTVIVEAIELQNKTITPTTESQNVTADEGYDGLGTVIVEAVISAIDQNIIAENIKKDVEILGVTGTYEETVELQDKTVSPTTIKQEIVADENYDGLSKVTIEAIELQNKEISPSTSSQSVIPDKGYDGLREVTVNAIALQDKTVTPDAVRQEITYDSNYNGLGKVIVEAVEPVELQDKTVAPTTEIQRVTADVDYSGLGTVTINAVTSAIDKNIKAENIKNDVSILGVKGTYEGEAIETQEKTVSPSTTRQEITPDEGYDGLSKVTVNGVTNDIDENIKAENIKKDVAILGVTGTYEGSGGGDLDSRTYFLWQKGNSASWESLPFNKRFILPATNDVDNFGYTSFSYTKGIKDTSNLQVGQTIEFYNYGKGTTPCLTTEIKLVTDTYFMVSAGGNNVYLKRATDAAWEDYAELLDLPYSTYQIFDENTAGSDLLYDLYGPIKVNVPPQISMPTSVTITSLWAPVLGESHQITMSAGMDLRINVCMGSDNLTLSSTDVYLDVRDILTTPATITKKWGPGSTDYSIDIEFSATGSGYPCKITGKVTRVGASFPSDQLCSIIVMKA